MGLLVRDDGVNEAAEIFEIVDLRESKFFEDKKLSSCPDPVIHYERFRTWRRC